MFRGVNEVYILPFSGNCHRPFNIREISALERNCGMTETVFVEA